MTDDKVYDLPPTISKPVTCEDAISRKAVLAIFDEWFSTFNIADKRESPKAKINALQPVIPKQGLCKDCKFFEYAHTENVDGIPLLVRPELCKR